MPKCVLSWIISLLPAVPYRTGILHWSVLSKRLPPSPHPTCVHIAIIFPEVVKCHPVTTPCCNVRLHFEVAVYSLYVPNKGCTQKSRNKLKIVGAKKSDRKQDPYFEPTISGCQHTESGCYVPRTCASLC